MKTIIKFISGLILDSRKIRSNEAMRKTLRCGWRWLYIKAFPSRFFPSRTSLCDINPFWRPFWVRGWLTGINRNKGVGAGDERLSSPGGFINNGASPRRRLMECAFLCEFRRPRERRPLPPPPTHPVCKIRTTMMYVCKACEDFFLGSLTSATRGAHLTGINQTNCVSEKRNIMPVLHRTSKYTLVIKIPIWRQCESSLKFNYHVVTSVSWSWFAKRTATLTSVHKYGKLTQIKCTLRLIPDSLKLHNI